MNYTYDNINFKIIRPVHPTAEIMKGIHKFVSNRIDTMLERAAMLPRHIPQNNNEFDLTDYYTEKIKIYGNEWDLDLCWLYAGEDADYFY